MKVLLNSLKNAPGGTKKYQLQVLPPDEFQDTVKPAQVEFTASYTGSGVLVTGNLETVYHTSCDRCLKATRQEVSIGFQEEFRQRESEPVSEEEDDEQESEIVLDEEELNIDYFSGNELDLSDFFRQMTILALPPKVVCRHDCPGLCPHCGADLATESCQCEQVDMDPRMAKLQKLKKDL